MPLSAGSLSYFLTGDTGHTTETLLTWVFSVTGRSSMAPGKDLTGALRIEEKTNETDIWTDRKSEVRWFVRSDGETTAPGRLCMLIV